MSKVDVVLFDFDGVLCDTGLLHTQTLARAVREVLGPRDDRSSGALEETLEAFGTIPSREKLRLIAIHPHQIAMIYEKKQEFILSEELPDCEPNIHGVVAHCRAMGRRMGIVSNTNYAIIARWLRRNERLARDASFFPIITNDWGLPSKPQPHPYYTACSLLNASPSDVLAIEDSPNGCASALRAGCQLLHVDNSTQLTYEEICRWV